MNPYGDCPKCGTSLHTWTQNNCPTCGWEPDQ